MPDLTLKKEDYEEPLCLLDMKPQISSVPIGRVLEKLDAYLNRRDYDAAERHLAYWLEEAERGNDERGSLTLLNEQIGLFRKTEQQDKCLGAAESALKLSMKLEASSASRGTTLVNAATGYRAFGHPDKAQALYEQARLVYEEHLSADDDRLAALYNNMAVNCAALGKLSEARELYSKAAAIIASQPGDRLELAVTKLNLADLINLEKGPEAGENEINLLLGEAEELLENAREHNGYYAFICEKCAPCFGYYGWFVTERKLRLAAKEIYEGT